jgi:hypothetical protein
VFSELGFHFALDLSAAEGGAESLGDFEKETHIQADSRIPLIASERRDQLAASRRSCLRPAAVTE